MRKLMEYIKNNRKLIGFIEDNKDMLIKVAAVAAVVVVAFFVFASKADKEDQIVVKDSVTAAEADDSAGESIFEDIGGEVNTPMVAELKAGSRVGDVIEAAGGLTEKADISEINRAAFVEDGEKIFVPALISTEENGISESRETPVYSDGKININTADSQELQELNGVGPATAEKIIDYREENGRFASIDDLKDVSGIGDKSFEKIKDKIKV